MVRSYFCENEKRIRAALPIIEKENKIHLFLKNKTVFIKGEEYEEFIIEKILKAVDFGFPVEKAMLIKNGDYDFRIINIKNYARRSRLNDIRGRLIGKKGKARKTMEEISGAEIKIRKNSVGIIADNDHINYLSEALVSLINGSKHSNVFNFLEESNVEIKKKEIEKQDFIKERKSF